MMATMMTVLAVFIASCRMCSASMDCSVPTASDIANVISDIIEDSPAISVVELRPLCLAHGRLRGSYRYVSVLVKYTCSGSSHCPTQSPAVEQFESQCIEGAWSSTVAYSTTNTRTTNPTANFSTNTRNNCSLCLSQELIDDVPYPYITHTSTHCVACGENCDDGLMQCYGLGLGDCCSYYNASTCVDVCPSVFVPNTEYDCVCPVGTTGHDCLETIDCGALEDPQNGMALYSSTTYNSVAIYFCIIGYNLTGNRSKTCLNTGFWSSSEPPNCTVITCGEIEAPMNGVVSISTTTYNSVANYSCNTGYTLTGNVSRTCLNTGLWSDSQPNCTIIDCGPVEDPKNGMVLFSTTTYNSVANFSCNTGYVVSGDASQICLDTGFWSGGKSSCTVIDCGALGDPENGVVSLSTTTYNSVANYCCNTGYTLTGNESRICLDAGHWSDSEPTCSGIIRFTIKAQSSIRDSSSPSPSPPPQTSSSTLGPFIGEVAGALLSAMITVTAVAILIGILVCYKRRVKATIANETHYFVAELSTIVSSIQTSTNTAYELSENKTRLVAVQRKESQVQQASEGDVSVVHIETGANSAYGVLQKNFRV